MVVVQFGDYRRLKADSISIREQTDTLHRKTALPARMVDGGPPARVSRVSKRAQALFRDHFIGVVRKGHPLSEGTVTAQSYAEGKHIHISRDGRDEGGIDGALAVMGLERHIAAIVGGFSGAVALARGSELIATVPERHTVALRAGTQTFPLPISLPEVTVSLLWHPRLHADPAHRWLRVVSKDMRAGPLFLMGKGRGEDGTAGSRRLSR